MTDDAGRLVDMLEAIDKITFRLGGERREFDTNGLLQV